MAKIIRCANGHYYDFDKGAACPYCRKTQADRVTISNGPGSYSGSDENENMKTQAMLIRDGQTIMIGSGNEDTLPFATEKLHGLDAPREYRTNGIMRNTAGIPYVTGWLVGIAGPVKGRDYRLIHGKNWVGVSGSNDICIREGSDIAWERQCAIVYDGKGNRFYVLQGTGTTTYLNGELVGVAQELKVGDEIAMGDCTFIFIPYCSEERVWEVQPYED